MALTVNTMLSDGGGGSSLKEKRKAQIAANEALWDRGEAAIQRYEDALAQTSPDPPAPVDDTQTPDPNVGSGGYTGGGSVSVTPSAPTTPAPEATPYAYNGWKAPTLNPAADQSDYIRELYQMQQDASLKALEDAYNKSVLGLDTRAEKIPDVYYEANRVQQGADAKAQQAANEYFAARGLNTGTAGQAQLAQNAVTQQNTAAINQAEADALAAVEADRTALTMDYQAQVREAIANNEMEKAVALYEEALRLDQSITNTALKQAELDYKQYQLERADAEARAQMLASIGDFSGYKALGYTDAEVAAMQAYYDAANTPVYYSGPAKTTEDEVVTTTEMQNVINQIDKGNGPAAQKLLAYYTKSGRITPEQETYIYNYAGV